MSEITDPRLLAQLNQRAPQQMPPARVPGLGPKPSAQLDPQIDAANLSRIYSDIGNDRARLGLEAERFRLQKEEADRKAAEDTAKAQKMSQAQDALGDAAPVFRAIEKAQPKIGWTTTGLGGSILQYVPGSDARALQAAVDPIKANLTFDALQKLRNSSPTGGAVGNASDADMRLLGSRIANIDPTQMSAKDFKSNLDFIGKQYISLLRKWGYRDDQIRLLNPTENLFPDVTGQREKERSADTRVESLSDPQKAVMGHVGELVARGAPDEDVLAALRQGFPGQAPDPQLLRMLEQRKDPNSPLSKWIEANPGRPIPFDQTREVPMSQNERAISELVQSPAGSFASGMASPGLSALGAGAFLTGNEDEANAIARGLRDTAEANPATNLAGSLVGGMMLPGGASLSLGRQAALGAGTGALEGFGGTEGGLGERLGSAAFGGALGAGAVPLARGAGTIGGAIASDLNRSLRGANYSTNAALRDLGLTPDLLKKRAADFQKATGRKARIVDLLEPDEATRLTEVLGRSPEAGTTISRAAVSESRALPERLAASTRQSSEPLTSRITTAGRVSDEADQAFDAMRGTPLTLSTDDLDWLRDNVAKEVAPKSRAALREFQAVLGGKSPLTVGMLDTMRKKLRKLASTNPGEGYAEMADDLEDLAAGQVPELKTAISNYRSGREMVEGAEAGRAATGQGENAGLLDFNAVLADAFRKTKPGTTTGANFMAGAKQGARSEIFQDALESPAGAYRLASNLSESPATRERLISTLGADEAAKVIQAAQANKNSVDAFMSLARIPPDRIPATLSNAGDIAQAIAVAGQGGSSFAVAHIAKNLKDMVGVGKATADKLAERLLDPNTTDEAIDQLKKKRLNRQSVTKIMQNALFYTAANVAGRVASGPERPEQ